MSSEGFLNLNRSLIIKSKYLRKWGNIGKNLLLSDKHQNHKRLV